MAAFLLAWRSPPPLAPTLALLLPGEFPALALRVALRAFPGVLAKSLGGSQVVRPFCAPVVGGSSYLVFVFHLQSVL